MYLYKYICSACKISARTHLFIHHINLHTKIHTIIFSPTTITQLPMDYPCSCIFITVMACLSHLFKSNPIKSTNQPNWNWNCLNFWPNTIVCFIYNVYIQFTCLYFCFVSNIITKLYFVFGFCWIWS